MLMPRLILGALAAVVSLLVTVVTGFIVMFRATGWLHSMMINDPVRQLWQPRVDYASSHFIELAIATSLLLFCAAWCFTNGFRGR